jgi:hypothetical protein
VSAHRLDLVTSRLARLTRCFALGTAARFALASS